jgi:hypothetical protein
VSLTIVTSIALVIRVREGIVLSEVSSLVAEVISASFLISLRSNVTSIYRSRYSFVRGFILNWRIGRSIISRVRDLSSSRRVASSRNSLLVIIAAIFEFLKVYYKVEVASCRQQVIKEYSIEFIRDSLFEKSSERLVVYLSFESKPLEFGEESYEVLIRLFEVE